MIMDQQLVFSDAQVLTETAASTNILDLGGATYTTGYNGAAMPQRTLGTGYEQLVCVVDISAVSGTNPTLLIALQGSTAEAFGSPMGLDEFLSGVAFTPVANTQVPHKFSPRIPYRYYRLYYTVAGTNPSITVTAAIVMNAQTSRMSQSY